MESVLKVRDSCLYPPEKDIEGELFTKRYEIWVSAYALLYQRDIEKNAESNQNENSGLSDEIRIKMEMKEKCRAAIIAAQFASKEVEQLTETSIPK